MENPLIRNMAIGGSQFGGPFSHNHSLRFKQLESTSSVTSRSSESLESKIYDILKGFGFQEAVIQQAVEILLNGDTSKTYAAEDVLEVIYQMEDEAEQETNATSESVFTESVPKYTDKKQNYQHNMRKERNGPSHHTVCFAANVACSSSHTYKSTHTSNTECNRNPEVTMPECNAVTTVLTQNKILEDTGEERRRSKEDLATNSSSHLGDCEVSKSSTTANLGEDSAKTPGVSHDSKTENKTATEEEIFKGGNAASRKKNKKKKKGSKHKENNDIRKTSQVELEESCGNKNQTQSDKKSQVFTSDQTEKKQENVWVDVRPKEPLQHNLVIKNSKTNEDVSKLIEENKKMLAAKFCRICKVNPANLLLLPCRHLACCLACGDATDNCPLCDTQVIATVKTYMS